MNTTHTLPPRKTCPSCYAMYAVIPFVERLHPETLAYVTTACHHRAPGASGGRRCGHPYAVVFARGAVEFVPAPTADRTFDGLQGALRAAYGV